jgi:exonuclease VII large subunit
MRKKCNTCKKEKEISAFYKSKCTLDGWKGECKLCSYEFSRSYTQRNKEKVKNYKKKWYELNKEKLKEVDKERYQSMKYERKQYAKNYYYKNKERLEYKKLKKLNSLNWTHNLKKSYIIKLIRRNHNGISKTDISNEFLETYKIYIQLKRELKEKKCQN